MQVFNTVLQTTEEKLKEALALLDEAETMFENSSPSPTWHRRLSLLNGEQAILTEDGWQAEPTHDEIEQLERDGVEIIEKVNC